MKGCLKYAGIGFLLLMIAGYFLAPSEEEMQEIKSKVEAENKEDRERLAKAKEIQAEMTKWRYSDQEDEMTGKLTKFAQVISENKVNFEFPYNGGSNLELTFRKKGKSLDAAYIRISKGQFVSKYDGASISVRFDDLDPVNYKVSESSTYSTDILFINSKSGFLKRVKNAKTIKIQADFYQEGSKVFTFDTEDLEF